MYYNAANKRVIQLCMCKLIEIIKYRVSTVNVLNYAIVIITLVRKCLCLYLSRLSLGGNW